MVVLKEVKVAAAREDLQECHVKKGWQLLVKVDYIHMVELVVAKIDPAKHDMMHEVQTSNEKKSWNCSCPSFYKSALKRLSFVPEMIEYIISKEMSNISIFNNSATPFIFFY